MSSQLRKVSRGETLRIPADTWNTLMDVARSYREGVLSQGVDGRGLRTRAGIVTVRNASGVDQGRFAVMGVSGIVISPTDNDLEFQSRPAFDVAVPSADDADKFAILTGPIAAGRLGHAMLMGVTPVKLNILDVDDEKAQAVSGQTGYLETGTGIARILWKEAGTGLKWGVVQFPAGAKEKESATLWGIITACDKSTGLASVQPADGTIGGLVSTGEPEITAWNGVNPWHRAGDEVCCLANPEGVSPAWTIVDKIAGFHWAPPAPEDIAPHTTPSVEAYCTGIS